MHNYFNYFTEIEERFQQRRGSLLMLSTLDWALIETWREAGVPLAAVLQGIDAAFDKHDAKARRTQRTRKVNGLAWCAQAVLHAVEDAREASIGAPAPAREDRETGFEAERVARFLLANAALVDPQAPEIAERLRALAAEDLSLEDLDRILSALEEKLFATLMTSTPEAELVALKEQAARELAPYKGKMQAVHIRQVQQQFLQKKLLEARNLPRLSLFYMGHA